MVLEFEWHQHETQCEELSSLVQVLHCIPWCLLKIKHSTHDLSSTKDSTYNDWFATDYSIISWLVNSMEENIVAVVMFLNLTKKI